MALAQTSGLHPLALDYERSTHSIERVRDYMVKHGAIQEQGKTYAQKLTRIHERLLDEKLSLYDLRKWPANQHINTTQFDELLDILIIPQKDNEEQEKTLRAVKSGLSLTLGEHVYIASNLERNLVLTGLTTLALGSGAFIAGKLQKMLGDEPNPLLLEMSPYIATATLAGGLIWSFLPQKDPHLTLAQIITEESEKLQNFMNRQHQNN